MKISNYHVDLGIYSRSVFLIAILAIGLSANSALAQVYKAAKIYSGSGSPIHDGALVVSNGKVTWVGPAAELDIQDEQVVDLGNATLIPGLVIARTNLVESASSSQYAISPEIRAADGFDPFDDYDRLVASGITTVQISSTDSRLMPGQGAVVKLAAKDPANAILAATDSLDIVLQASALRPPTVYEPPVGAVSVDRPYEQTQPQLASSLAEAVVGLKAIFAESMENGAASEDIRLSSIANVLESGQKIRWHVDDAADISATIALLGMLENPYIFVDPTDVDSLLASVDWNSKEAIGVILESEVLPGRISIPSASSASNRPDELWVRAKKLKDAGARTAFVPASDSDLADVMFLASILGRAGYSTTEILETITSASASILGVSQKVGSLAAKADADFVVLSGEPFAPGTQVLATYVDGEAVFEQETTSDQLVIKAGQVYAADGIIENASVAVAEGVIQSLGSSVSSTSDSSVKDFGDAVVVPGYIDLSTTLGIGGSLSTTISLGTKLGEFLSRDDKQIQLARQGGVTTAFLSSSRLPSPVLAYKLADTPTVVADPVALKFQIKGNLTSARESNDKTLKSAQAYAESWNKYDKEYANYKDALTKYEADKKKYDAAVKAAEEKKAAEAKKAADASKKADEKKAGDSKEGAKPSTGKPSESTPPKPSPKEEKTDGKSENKKDEPKGDEKEDSESKESKDKKEEPKLTAPKKPTEPKKPRASSTLEPYRPLFAGKIVAIIDCENAKAIGVALDLFCDKYKLKTAIIADQAAIEMSAKLEEKGVMVILGPSLAVMSDGKRINLPAELGFSRVKVGFQSKSTTGMKNLPDAVAYSVYLGTGSKLAVSGLTSTPAEFFGLEQTGSLKEGNAADLVVLSGPPLQLSSEVLAVMIDGKWVYEKENE